MESLNNNKSSSLLSCMWQALYQTGSHVILRHPKGGSYCLYFYRQGNQGLEVLSDSSMARELASGRAVIQIQVQPGSKTHAFDAPPLGCPKISRMLSVCPSLAGETHRQRCGYHSLLQALQVSKFLWLDFWGPPTSLSPCLLPASLIASVSLCITRRQELGMFKVSPCKMRN